MAAALNDTISAAAGSGATSTKLPQRWNDEWEEEQRGLNEKWNEILWDEPMWTKILFLQLEQLYEANLFQVFANHLDHPEVQALIEKQKMKIRELIDAGETEGKKIEKTGFLLLSSSHEKIKQDDSHSECL